MVALDGRAIRLIGRAVVCMRDSIYALCFLYSWRQPACATRSEAGSFALRVIHPSPGVEPMRSLAFQIHAGEQTRWLTGMHTPTRPSMALAKHSPEMVTMALLL